MVPVSLMLGYIQGHSHCMHPLALNLLTLHPFTLHLLALHLHLLTLRGLTCCCDVG